MSSKNWGKLGNLGILGRFMLGNMLGKLIIGTIAVVFILSLTQTTEAAVVTWDGGGADNNWPRRPTGAGTRFPPPRMLPPLTPLPSRTLP